MAHRDAQQEPLVASLFLVASLLLVVRPGAPSSVLALDCKTLLKPRAAELQHLLQFLGVTGTVVLEQLLRHTAPNNK